jgi:hypothetical protein
MEIRDWVINELFPGWKNILFRRPVIEQMALERLSICKDCEYRTGRTCDKKKGVYDAKGNFRHGCGCFVDVKARSPLSACPFGKWGIRGDLR